MKITQVAAFIFEDGVRVEFVPIKNAPPCTHKVYVLKQGTVVNKDWFVPTHDLKKPGKKSAAFYYNKHIIEPSARTMSERVAGLLCDGIGKQATEVITAKW